MVEANKHIFFKHLLDPMRLIYAAFILLLVLMTSAQCQQTAEDWFNKGDLLLNLGKYNESIEAYNKAIELNQSFAAAWKQKGNALLNLAKYNESLECYNKAIKLDPNYAKAWSNKGVALGILGRYDEAIKAYDEAIRLNPNFSDAWNNKGIALHDLGKYDEAIKAYDEAIKLDPNLAAAWIGKGNALNAQNKYNKTIKNNSQIAPSLAINVPVASTAISIQHGPFMISFDPGRSYSRVNTTGPFRLLGPDGKTWINDYVLTCYDHDDAIATSILIYKLDFPTFDLSSPFPTKPVYTDLISEGVDSNTIYAVQRTISGSPGVFGWGYSTKSKSYAYEMSWYISTKSVAHVFSYNEEEAGKIVNSIVISEYGSVTDSTSQNVFHPVVDQRTTAYAMPFLSPSQNLRTTDPFYLSMMKSIRLDPNLAIAWNKKGVTLSNQGKYDEAIKCYDEAIRLDPYYALAWSNKGSALNEQGKYDDAIKVYDEIIRLASVYGQSGISEWETKMAWISKGNALKILHRTTEANAAFAKAKELGFAV